MKDFAETFVTRYNTALIADAAFRAGVPVLLPGPGILPLENHYSIAGPVRTVEANNDLVSIISAVHHAQPGEIALISNKTKEVGLIGDLIAADALRGGLAGIVVDGMVRDTADVRKLGFPVFSRGQVPVGPLKLPAELRGLGRNDVEVTIGGVDVQPGMWLFGDSDGVFLVNANDLAAVQGWAEKSSAREAAILQRIEAGEALGEILGIDEFRKEREQNPGADFNTHLARRGEAI